MNHLLSLQFCLLSTAQSHVKEGDDDESTKTLFYLFRGNIQGKRMEIKEIECGQPSLVLVGSGRQTQLTKVQGGRLQHPIEELANAVCKCS